MIEQEYEDTSSAEKVLIVDDNAENLSVLFSLLDSKGYELAMAQDGSTALSLAAELKPSIILLDVMMPDISGFEVCRKLKANRATQSIPVIFLSALSSTDDKVTGFECGGVDFITKPFQLEEVLARVATHLTLQKQREDLIRLNRIKDRFFSIIAHDIRGPLSTFLGSADLLRHAANDDDRDTAMWIADVIQSTARSTHELLENLLLWSRAQQGASVFAPERVMVAAIVERVIVLFGGRDKQKQIELVSRIEDDLEFTCDANMMEAIVRNLVSNAIKFTKSDGSVSIVCCQSDGLQLSVVDTGVGMSNDDAAKLFRGDVSLHRRGTDDEKGSGFGLLLVKDYVDIHRGSISVESEIGTGTTITVRFPDLSIAE